MYIDKQLFKSSTYKDVDFILDIPHGKTITVLQITDTQIIDASQARSVTRLSSTSKTYWAKGLIEERCFQYLRKMIQAVMPDLILLTGDLVYGEFDDTGSSFLEFIAFINGFGIPWAPVFGNHDNESVMGVDWQCQQLTNASNCLFLQRQLTGNGNYSVGIRQDGELKRVFIMLDSNGCQTTNTNVKSKTVPDPGFGEDQILWYTSVVQAIKLQSPNTKFSFAFHIQPQSFADAFKKYGFTNHNTADAPIDIDAHPNAMQGDFGYLGADLKSSWDYDGKVWNGLRSLGVDSVFVGHEHSNSASVMYQGIRCQYGQKSSTYDRVNYFADGKVVCSFKEAGIPIVGGTVIPIAPDGSLSPYIYYASDFAKS